MVLCEAATPVLFKVSTPRRRVQAVRRWEWHGGPKVAQLLAHDQRKEWGGHLLVDLKLDTEHGVRQRLGDDTLRRRHSVSAWLSAQPRLPL